MILVCCISFVLYMSFISFSNYLKQPQGVNLIMKDPRDEIMPQFTICSKEKLNETILQLCGIKW